MKKTISNILFAALLVFAAASCQKELGFEPQSEGLRTITCYMETPSDTKGGGGATLPEWHIGDQIWISNGTSSETKTLEAGDIDGNKVTLSTSLSGTLYAVCPASAQNGVTNDGKIGIKIPTSTTGTFAEAHIAVAQGDGTLSFKNAVTILNIATSDAIAAVNISSTANIAGEFNVTYGSSLTLEAGASQAKSVTLTSSTGGARYVAIAPGTAFNTVTFTAIKTATNWAVRTSTSANSAAINTIYTIGNVANSGDGWTYTGDTNGSLWGQFSVSADKKVRFSKGNLQATYNGSSYDWDFAANQYDFVGNNPGNTTIDSQTDGNKVDLFTWVGEGCSYDAYGINTANTGYSTTDMNSPLKSDWGVAYCTSKSITPTTTWYTLSSDYWGYIINSRSASKINGTANARYMKCQVDSKSGLLLFPDSFTWPTVSGAPAESNATKINNENADYSVTYTSAEFATLEAAGAVFLPAGGKRNGSSIESPEYGFYWSSTHGTSDKWIARYLYFNYNAYTHYVASTGNDTGGHGRSVRLVTD